MESFQIRRELYTAEDLYDKFYPEDDNSYELCYDALVYADVLKDGKRSRSLSVTLPRTIHDHSISDALFRFLSEWSPSDVVGVMGGHAMKRSDPSFRKVALVSKHLTEAGKLMVSGGGPGAMEATHFGAWMAGRNDADLDKALEILKAADTFADKGWLSTAFRVRERFPQSRFRSLGIPTWLYGHEPPTPFATHIAKYFDNSIREDNILTIAVGGIIFSPGSAGTLQEVFQEAAQDHYKTCDVSSPIVFFGKDFWQNTVPLYQFLDSLMKSGYYKDLLLSIYDEPDDIVREILAFKPDMPGATQHSKLKLK